MELAQEIWFSCLIRILSKTKGNFYCPNKNPNCSIVKINTKLNVNLIITYSLYN